MKNQSLRVLIIEDSEDDVLLLIRELKRGGFNPVYERIETAAAMKKALKKKQWDIILCDYRMPNFSAPSAIVLLKETNIDIPLIVVSGVVGEETAAECMRLGAQDYVMKFKLSRLCPAISRELEEAEVRRRQKQAEDALRASEVRYRRLFESAKDGILILDIDKGIIIDVNPFLVELLGYSREQLIGKALWELGPFKDIIPNRNKFLELQRLKYIRYEDLPLETRDGRLINVEFVSNVYDANHTKIIQCNIRDITERKKTEEKNRKIEENLKIVLAHAHMGTWELDISTQTFFWSDEMFRIFGFNPALGPPLLKDFINQVYPDDRELLDLYITKNTEERPHSLEHRFVRSDGNIIWIDCHSKHIFDDKGNMIKYVGASHDITDRKKMEEKLLFINKAVESSSDAIGISDPQGRHFYHNKAATELLGYTLEELESSVDHPDVYTNKDTAIEVFSTIMSGKSWSGEVEMISKSGRKIPVILRADAIKDEGGKIIGLIGVHTDISARKRAEETIEKSETKYRNIFENAIEGIYQVTTDGKFITANNALARMAGYNSPEDFIESIKDIRKQLYVHPEERDRFLKIIKANDIVEGFETEFYKKDGSIFWVVINARAINDEKGKLLYNEGLIEDITIRKHAEEQLKNSLESLRKAVGTTIHVLVSALEARDPYTAGHQSRVANLARTIATEIGLDKDKIEGIRMAGVIHDIGKLSIPAEILTKPAKLTDLEFSLVKEHAQKGYEMLKDVESPWPLADIVHQHHERINGSGYPRNLKRDDIIIEARILAVADVVEAMASHRPYRASLGIDSALEEVEKNKGILYDEAVADACLILFRKKGYQLK
jgi:PAS domain S-box-containing protein/putative nucleotidyltransferase with HDIG domain